MSRAGLSREEEVWPSRGIMKKEGSKQDAGKGCSGETILFPYGHSLPTSRAN